MSDKIKKLTDDSFDKDIEKGVVLVDFYADWCGPCRMMTPVLEKIAEESEGKATIGKIDIDQSQKVAAKFQITSIPTLILFKDNKEVGRLVGLQAGPAIKDFIATAK